MTDEELKKIYFPIAEIWKMIREFRNCTGTDEECRRVQERADQIYKAAGKTAFAKEQIVAAVNEIDRIMMRNRGE